MNTGRPWRRAATLLASGVTLGALVWAGSWATRWPSSPTTVATVGDVLDRWRPRPGLTWYWQLSGTIDTQHDVDVYDIDYETPAHVVADLRRMGRHVIAYLPIGNWEPYRPDADDFPDDALCGPIPGWPERYVDIRHPTVRTIIEARIAYAARQGFHGIEGDVVDLHHVDTGCTTPISEADMTGYVRELTAIAHGLGLAYFAKNVPENAPIWATITDGVIVEEAYRYREAAAYEPYVRADKPVLAVEYGSTRPTDAECIDANERHYALYATDLALSGAIYKTCW